VLLYSPPPTSIGSRLHSRRATHVCGLRRPGSLVSILGGRAPQAPHGAFGCGPSFALSGQARDRPGRRSHRIPGPSPRPSAPTVRLSCGPSLVRHWGAGLRGLGRSFQSWGPALYAPLGAVGRGSRLFAMAGLRGPGALVSKLRGRAPMSPAPTVWSAAGLVCRHRAGLRRPVARTRFGGRALHVPSWLAAGSHSRCRVSGSGFVFFASLSLGSGVAFGWGGLAPASV
jgi:hypothetical protein